MAVLSSSVIYLSAGCRPVTTIPIHRPLKGSDISIASVHTLIIFTGTAQRDLVL